MAHCTQKGLDSHRNYTINPKCCLKPPDLQCAGDFNPPVLGTSSDFCNEALSKGLPIQECTLTQPQRLEITTEPFPDPTPPTHRNLKNWQKWCRIWKLNQERLALKRQNDTVPTLMTCGESCWYKNEDKELFDRTLYHNYITGYNIKNVLRPDGIRPCGNTLEIQETLFPRHYRVYPEMKRYRYSKRIRNELGLTLPCNDLRYQSSVTTICGPIKDYNELEDFDQKSLKDATGHCYNWEQSWKKSISFLSGYYWYRYDKRDLGYPDPNPDNLILQAPTLGPGKFSGGDTAPQNINVPEFTFTLDGDRTNDELRTKVTNQGDSNEQSYYTESRGPVLLVKGRRTETQLSCKQVDLAQGELIDSLKEQYFREELDLFSATTRGKETRYMALKNEGTTAIRYQWTRFPPNKETIEILANPARSVAEKGYFKNTKQPGIGSESIAEKVYKPSCLEFHFRELPGVLLPGQSLEFPIVFRSQKPGYYYETLYLVTHPRLRDEENRSYSIRLTGICMDPDLLEAEKEQSRPENVDEVVKQTTLEQEAMDLMDSILDHALFIEPDAPSTLPFLKVTSEGIFYSHNKHLKYHYGTADKSLEAVRSLIELLVPKERIDHNENLCTLSIKGLYQLLWSRNTSKDLYWSHFKSPQAEKMLKTLSEYNNILCESRRFCYPSANTRKQTACYASIITLTDEILSGMEYINTLYNSADLENIYISQAKEKFESGKLKDEGDSDWNAEAFVPIFSNYVINKSESTVGAKIPDLEEVLKVEPKEEIVEPPKKAPEEPIQDLKEKDNKKKGSKSKEEKDPKTESAPTKKGKKKGSIKDIESKEKDKKKENKHKEDKDPKTEITPAKKVKKTAKGEGPQGKDKMDTSAAEDEEPEIVSEAEEPRSARTEKVDSEPETVPLPLQDPEDLRRLSLLSNLVPAVRQEVLNGKKQRLVQAKRMVFEDLLASGIERMLCVVDNLNAMEDYRRSDYVTESSSNYCCED